MDPSILQELFTDFPFKHTTGDAMLAEIYAAFHALKQQVIDLAYVAEQHVNESAVLRRQLTASQVQSSAVDQKRIAIEGELVQLRLQLEASRAQQGAEPSQDDSISKQYVAEAKRQVQLFLEQKDLEYSRLLEQNTKQTQQLCNLAVEDEYRKIFQQQEANLKSCLDELEQLRNEKKILVQKVAQATIERPSVKESVLQKLQEKVAQQNNEIERLTLQTPENLAKQLRILQDTVDLERLRGDKLEDALEKQKRSSQELKQMQQEKQQLQQMYDDSLEQRAAQALQLKKMEAALASSAEKWDAQTAVFQKLIDENAALRQAIQVLKEQRDQTDSENGQMRTKLEELQAENQMLMLRADEMATIYAQEVLKLKQEDPVVQVQVIDNENLEMQPEEEAEENIDAELDTLNQKASEPVENQ